VLPCRFNGEDASFVVQMYLYDYTTEHPREAAQIQFAPAAE
jgi:hypothetical protein